MLCSSYMDILLSVLLGALPAGVVGYCYWLCHRILFYFVVRWMLSLAVVIWLYFYWVLLFACVTGCCIMMFVYGCSYWFVVLLADGACDDDDFFRCTTHNTRETCF